MDNGITMVATDHVRVWQAERDLTECEWGWLVDDRDYIEHVEGTRLDEAISLLEECAEAGR